MNEASLGEPAIVCAGHPRDMGQAQGEALREVIRAAVARAGLSTRRSRWPSLRPVVSGPLRGSGAGREFFRHFAHQAERLEGLAQAADLPLDSLLALQLRVGAGALAGGELGDAAWIVRESRPVVGFRSLERTLAWLVPAVAGVNEAGLALIAPLPSAGARERTAAAAGSRSGGNGTAPPRAVDAPSLLLVQDCLARFEHLAGALDWCRKRPAEGEQTIVLADASGGRGAVEFRGRERRVESSGAADAGAGVPDPVGPRAGELTGELLVGGAGRGPERIAIDPVARILRVTAAGSGAPHAFGFVPLPPSGAHAA
jgi:hypothetical protein